MKREESPSRSESQSQGQDQSSPGPRTSRAGGFGRIRENVVPQAISEGRRLYVGNMPYTAKMEDVKELFSKGGFEAYVHPALFYLVELCCERLTDSFF